MRDEAALSEAPADALCLRVYRWTANACTFGYSQPFHAARAACDALIAIRAEAAKVEKGEWSRTDNPLKNAPHTAEAVAADAWPHAYGRETAAYPAPWLRERKFWPAVGRIDGAYGDRNFFCSCSALS